MASAMVKSRGMSSPESCQLVATPCVILWSSCHLGPSWGSFGGFLKTNGSVFVLGGESARDQSQGPTHEFLGLVFNRFRRIYDFIHVHVYFALQGLCPEARDIEL